VSGATFFQQKITDKMINKQRYTEGFKSWLQALNYTSTSIISYPTMVGQMLDYMTQKAIENIASITGEDVKMFFDYLSKRPNERRGGALSISTLRTYLTVIKLFAKYMRQTEQGQIDVPVQYTGKSTYTPKILSTTEIEQIYESLEDGLMGMRDRAMMAVYYGCGARKSEGAAIKIQDILPDRNLLYIRKGKNYKERYIPMIGSVKKDIIAYLTLARPMLMNGKIHDHFLVTNQGEPLSGVMISQRMRQVMLKARIEPVGLHGLRHSIATHLLNQGMKLTDIAKFLGHSSLETTQIYTHLNPK
jgi:integrase/recombinase XerD